MLVFWGNNLYVVYGKFLPGLLYDKMIQYILGWICIKTAHV